MAAYAASKTVDRDGWIRVQKKTFTRWANNHLKTRGLEIADLCEDVRSGVLLLNLLEIIGGESVKQVLNVKVCSDFDCSEAAVLFVSGCFNSRRLCCASIVVVGRYVWLTSFTYKYSHSLTLC
jgi:DNA-binding transcriptional MocR family regulator